VPRYHLSGKVALVTGGARGIGFATAQALIARGATVIVADLEAASSERAASQLHDTRAAGLAVDVRDIGALQRAVALAVDRFGGLDVVVANAGIGMRGVTLRAAAPETFERIVEVNLLGVHRTVAAALPEIIRRRGHVVVVSSVYAFVNGAGAMSYAMAKAGVEALGRALRVELAPHGASASVAYFGFIDTEMVRRAIDADPLGDAAKDQLPRPLRKRLPPSAAGEAIARGIERRAPRIIRPRAWVPFSVLRGVLNPLSDRRLERDAELLAMMRTLDDRAGEDLPTTA
jgi:NAD(P)-dependent dehydrogenase (short-subunit alcohol dehydrogenase family)